MPRPDHGLRPHQGRGREVGDRHSGRDRRAHQPALRAEAQRAGSLSSIGPSRRFGPGGSSASSRTSSGRRSIYRTAARASSGSRKRPPAGIVHVAGRERVSRYELMRRVASSLGFDAGLVRANRREDVVLAEPRPADVSLDTSRLASLLPDLDRPTIEEAIVTA